MATYYINAHSDYAVSPFTAGLDFGAHSFGELFADEHVVLADGDIIEVYCPDNSGDYDIDDSGTSTLMIDRNITIKCYVPDNAGYTVPPYRASVLAPDDQPLFMTTSRGSECTIQDIDFNVLVKGADATIYVQSSLNTSVRNCGFTYDAMGSVGITEFSTWVHAQNVVGMVVDSCSFDNPSNQVDGVYGASSVFIEISHDTTVSNNTFDFSGGISQGIYYKNSSNVRVSRNYLSGFINSSYLLPQGTYFNAITISRSTTVNASENTVYGIVNSYCGIYASCDDDVDANIMIRNNEIYTVYTGATNTACIVARVTKYIQIINNRLALIYYSGHPEYINNTTVAFDVRILKNFGIVDYNNIYKIEREIDNGGNPALIDSVGIHTTRDLSVGLSVGMGTEFTNIGVDFRRVTKQVPKSYYFSVVDTVLYTNNIGISRLMTSEDVTGSTDNLLGTYINDALVMSSATALTNRSHYMNDLSNDHYENQFDWDYIESAPFPFTKSSQFYGKNSDYVYQNRKDLWPFSNISCPANPGHGYIDGYSGDEYIDGKVGYQTGLFGYSRALWENGCGAPCIIQDTYRDVAKKYNSNIEATTVLINTIHPPCEGS